MRICPQENPSNGETWLIVAEGEVVSEGWTNPRLLPYTFVQSPEDGIWDFDFAADAPDGNVPQVITSIRAEYLMRGVTEGSKGVRVHASANIIECVIK